ncbi:hypothetical protein BUALT_Bualt03G0131800 [Buddleja alternifolia]|uniref:Uncharacterized protein n=1 Tax=Buddleja alternifolia TaxID=168488 RepID=A0AAV6Y1F3_9LAMI|nr:hypothetical protein BUALT_Bualt03G0131800 [Buddleja alternifolia]
MAAWTAAARRAVNLARVSPPKSAATSGQASMLIQRRGLAAGGGDHQGPPKFVIVSLAGWGLLFYGGYKFFTGDKKDNKEERVGESAH